MNTVPYTEVLDRAHELQAMSTDRMVPASELKVKNLSTMVLGGEEVGLSPVGAQQVCTFLQMPHNYIKKLPEALQEEQFNHWTNQLELKDPDKIFRVRMRNGKARGVLTSRFTAIDNFNLLERIQPFIEAHEMAVESYNLADPISYVRFVAPKGEAMQVGDEFRVGLDLTNSEVGWHSVEMQSLVWRMVCTNGAFGVMPEQVFRFRHIGGNDRRADQEIDGFFSQVANTSLNLDRLRRLNDVRLNAEGIEGHLEEFTHDSRIPKRIIPDVRKNWSKEPIESAYGVFNAITRLGHSAKGYQKRQEVESYGGTYVSWALRGISLN